MHLHSTQINPWVYDGLMVTAVPVNWRQYFEMVSFLFFFFSKKNAGVREMVIFDSNEMSAPENMQYKYADNTRILFSNVT